MSIYWKVNENIYICIEIKRKLQVKKRFIEKHYSQSNDYWRVLQI